MKYLVDSQEMKQYDENTISYYGISSAVLMERAALAVFNEIVKRFPDKKNRILVVCGAGNNGGDGLAVSRMLSLEGYFVQILFPMNEEKMTQETKAQYDTVKKYGLEIKKDLEKEHYDVIVDALFGIGLSRPIEGKLRDIIEKLNAKAACKIAVDIPSGISADKGNVLGTAFRADITITFGFDKIGQRMYPGADYCGELIVADIGICEKSFLGKIPRLQYLDETDIKEIFPKRKKDSNKGTYGKVLVIAGSQYMAGAAYFSAKASYLSGCGLVRILTPEENRQILLIKLPEVIVSTYDAKKPDLDELKDCLEWADVVLTGPGLGTGETAKCLVREVIRQQKLPVVLDADALNILSEDMSVLSQKHGELILTPHPGEMSRMIKKEIADIRQNLLQTAEEFSETYQVTCVLKDARTVISDSGRKTYINLTGNHGMATGGSGDVLAGLITGLLAQGLNGKEAAVLGCYLHGKAGDMAVWEKGAWGMLASDILEQIPFAMKQESERKEG